MGLSVAMAVKNESEIIERCLRSVQFADEIVVVDDCSTDDTVEKAKHYGAQVVTRDSKGSFHDNKNAAISMAREKWVLSLDADEIVTPMLAKSIQSVLRNPMYDGYLIVRHNYFLNARIRGCGWSHDILLRLFRKGKALWPLEIHDVPQLREGNGNLPILNGALIHFSYRSYEQYFTKFNAYTTRLAEEYAQRGTKIGKCYKPLNLFFRPLYWFVKKYFIMHGYRDGRYGLFISCSSALTIFVSHLKYLEMKSLANSDLIEKLNG